MFSTIDDNIEEIMEINQQAENVKMPVYKLAAQERWKTTIWSLGYAVIADVLVDLCTTVSVTDVVEARVIHYVIFSANYEFVFGSYKLSTFRQGECLRKGVASLDITSVGYNILY